MLFSKSFCISCSSEDSEPAAAKPAKPEKPVEVPWSEEDTDVFHLTENTFDEFIQTHGSALVMFYAPCKFLMGLFCMIAIERANGCCNRYSGTLI